MSKFEVRTALTGITRLLAVVAALLAGAVLMAHTMIRLSPKVVVQRFCNMDADGQALVPTKWRAMSRLLVAPEHPSLDTIVIIRDFVVSDPKMEADKALLYVEYVVVGTLDASFRFNELPTPTKIRKDYILSKLNENGWKIDQGRFQPHVSLRRAIQYVQERRKHAHTNKEKESLESTIASLRRELSERY